MYALFGSGKTNILVYRTSGKQTLDGLFKSVIDQIFDSSEI